MSRKKSYFLPKLCKAGHRSQVSTSVTKFVYELMVKIMINIIIVWLWLRKQIASTSCSGDGSGRIKIHTLGLTWLIKWPWARKKHNYRWNHQKKKCRKKRRKWICCSSFKDIVLHFFCWISSSTSWTCFFRGIYTYCTCYGPLLKIRKVRIFSLYFRSNNRV